MINEEVKHPDVTIKLVGQDGNAFVIMGVVSKALKRTGYRDSAEEFVKEATSGDYNHLIVAAMNFVNVI